MSENRKKFNGVIVFNNARKAYNTNLVIDKPIDLIYEVYPALLEFRKDQKDKEKGKKKEQNFYSGEFTKVDL
jgi:hypothetical protein